MLMFQGVAKEIADKVCYDNIENDGTKPPLPKSKYITQIKARASGTIKLIDAAIIAR